jgi:hypothetical protein
MAVINQYSDGWFLPKEYGKRAFRVMERVDGPIQHFLIPEVPSLLQVVTRDIPFPRDPSFHGGVEI